MAVVIAAVAAVLSWQIPHGPPPSDYLELGSSIAMAVFFTAIPIGVFACCRRLQDLSLDPFLVFYVLIAAWGTSILATSIGGWAAEHATWFSGIVLAACLLLLGAKPGVIGDNRYGPNPRVKS